MVSLVIERSLHITMSYHVRKKSLFLTIGQCLTLFPNDRMLVLIVMFEVYGCELASCPNHIFQYLSIHIRHVRIRLEIKLWQIFEIIYFYLFKLVINETLLKN